MFDFRLFVCLPVLQSLMLYFYNLAFSNFKDQTIEVYIPPVVVCCAWQGAETNPRFKLQKLTLVI